MLKMLLFYVIKQILIRGRVKSGLSQASQDLASFFAHTKSPVKHSWGVALPFTNTSHVPGTLLNILETSTPPCTANPG